MLALAQTVQTQLGNLPALPPVQGLLSCRFGDPKVPAPLSLWPIEAEAEPAGALGLFVPCIGWSVQPERWVEPEPVAAEILPTALEQAVEPAPVELVAAESPETVEAAQQGVGGFAPVPAGTFDEVVAVEPEVAVAPVPVETLGESIPTPVPEEVALAPAPVETPEESIPDHVPEEVDAVAIAPVAMLEESVPDTVTAEAVAAEPEVALAPVPVETLGESIPTPVPEEVALAPAPIETPEESIPDHVPEEVDAVALAPVGTLEESVPDTVTAEALAAEPEIAATPATVGTREDIVAAEPETEVVAAPVETESVQAAVPEEDVAVEPEVGIVSAPVETESVPAAVAEEVAAVEPEVALAPELTQPEPAPPEALAEGEEGAGNLPIQELAPGAVRPVSPKPWETVLLRYPDTMEPEFARISPLLVSSPSGPQMTSTAPTEPAASIPPPVVAAPRPKGKVPGWIISLMVATALSLGGAVIVRNMGFGSKPEPASAPNSQPGEAPGNSSPSYSFARFIEVTGLRVNVDLKNGSQLHYTLVNHGQTQLSNLQLRIDVHSTAAPENSKPLFTVSALVTGLEPSSSREMVANIDDLRDTVIPEWQFLKSTVQVVTQ